MRSIIAAVTAAASFTATTASAQTLVVLNKAEATITLLNPLTGEPDATLPVGDGPHEAATSPDGRTVVVCDYGQRTPGNTLTVIDLPNREVLRKVDLGENTRPHGIRFLDDDRVVVSTEGSNRIVVANIRRGEVEHELGTEQAASHMVEVSRDGKRAFVPNIRPGTVSIIDLESGELLKILETGAGAEGVFVHPNRDEIWVTNRGADTVTVIDSNTLEITAEMDSASFPIRIAITPSGEHALVSNARSGDVSVFDTTTHEEIARISMQAKAVNQIERDRRLFGDQFGQSPVPVGVLVQPDGRLAYVANTNADVVTVIDLETWAIAGRLVAGQEPDGMAWSHLPKR